MRYIKLSMSLIISMIGLVVYFVTIPQIDEDKFVELTVLAGDEELLDDYYFNGYVYNYGSYHLTTDDILIPNNLPYLQGLDATEDIEIELLNRNYPEFAKALNSAYAISEGENYLTSAYFNYDYKTYTEMHNQLQLSIMNKETKEIVEETVQRDNNSRVLYVEIAGIYESYPEVHVLINARNYVETNSYSEESHLSLVSYNFETKNMTEKTLLKEEEYIDSASYNRSKPNQPVQLFLSSDYDTQIDQVYLVDYVKGEIHNWKSNGGTYLLSDDNRIYNVIENKLTEYDETGQNIINEISLATDFKNGRDNFFANGQPYILDDKLFYLSNDYSTSNEVGATKFKPTHVVVYDMASGEILTEVQFDFEGTTQVGAMDAGVDFIGKYTSKD